MRCKVDLNLGKHVVYSIITVVDKLHDMTTLGPLGQNDV